MSLWPLETVGDDDARAALRREVRTFLDDEISSGRFVPSADSWATSHLAWDPAFSGRLAERGWVGMTIPAENGGRGLAYLDRFVVTEELLAAGAPVGAHWVADRQIAPSLLSYGSPLQKQRFLPEIAAARVFFALGMSEPDAGSDLASVRTSAVPVPGGWSLSGSKIWSTGAHHAHYIVVLARSDRDAGGSGNAKDRHSGLSQFIVDLAGTGVEVRPIRSMDGSTHFNEVFFDDVFVPEELLLGVPGDGWRQVTSELGFERSGPERVLSTALVLQALAAEIGGGTLPAEPEFGRLAARLAVLRRMSMSVAAALSAGTDVGAAASIVKVLGTVNEGDIAEYAAGLGATRREDPLGRITALAEAALLSRPSFTIRGGTNEILRGVIARQLGLR